MTTTPPVRTAASMCFDPIREKVVLYGGGQNFGPVGDTWEWDGTRWADVTPATGPHPASGQVLAFDSTTHQSLLFMGSEVFYSSVPETWSWSGSVWTRLSPAAQPTDRVYAAAASDSRRGRVVLFGGMGQSTLGDTWEWTGANWASVTTTAAPAARWKHAMAYDSVRGVTVLFGGEGADYKTNDTWEYDGTSWLRRSPAVAPSKRSGHVMSFEPVRGRVVLFGGNDDQGHLQSDTWEWDGTTWAPLFTRTRIPSRQLASMVHDATRGQTVLFGGDGLIPRGPWGDLRTQDTWILGPSASNSPPVAGAGKARVVSPGTPVRLSGSGSDRDGALLSYSWRRSSADPGDGPEVTLDLPLTPTPSFTPPSPGAYGFELTVSDGSGGTGTAEVTVFAAAWQPPLTRWATVSPVTTMTPRSAPSAAYDSVRHRVLVFGGTAPGNGFGLSELLEWTGRDWRLVPAAHEPPPTYGQAVAFDESRGRLVRFGGKAGGGYGYVNAEIWEYDGVDWTRLVPAVSPPARADHAMVYDAARRCVILFGGSTNGQDSLGDTWAWDGTSWTELAAGASPPARAYHQMAYDAARGRTVLFGGYRWSSENAYGTLADTWELDGTSWTERSPARWPRSRREHAMAYDAMRQKVVVFGGYGTMYQVLEDTWEYDGTNWSPLESAPHPEARYGLAMAHDAARGAMVAYGGGLAVQNNAALLAVWELRVDPPSTPPNLPPRALAGRARVVPAGLPVTLEGTASDPEGDSLSCSWARDPVDPGSGASVSLTPVGTAAMRFTPPSAGTYHFVFSAADPRGAVTTAPVTVFVRGSRAPRGTWRKVPAAEAPAPGIASELACGPGPGECLLFGPGPAGPLTDQTWLWNGRVWRRLLPPRSPPARTGHAMAASAARSRTLLFAGHDGVHPLADTWEFDGASWLDRAPAVSPPARTGHALAYDEARDRVLLFGGQGAGGALGDTWEWTGDAWNERARASHPPARAGHALAYDELRDRAVLFGGQGAAGPLDDTWVWDSHGWTRLEPPSRPPPRSGHSMFCDSALGLVVLFGGTNGSGGSLGDTWSFDGNTWSLLAPGLAPEARSGHAAAYDRARGRAVLFGGADAPADTWELSADPLAPVTPSSPVVSAGPSSVVTVGVHVTLSATAVDPDGDVVTYAWHRSGGGGPAVTLEGTAAASAHFTPASSGTYRFTVVASDGHGGAGATSVVVVAQPPGRTAAPLRYYAVPWEPIPYGPGHDLEPLTPAIEAAFVVDGLYLPDGTPVELVLERAGHPVRRTVRGFVQEFAARFPRVTLERDSTYRTAVLDPGGTAHGPAVLSDGGPPMAHITSWGAGGVSAYFCLGSENRSPAGLDLTCRWRLLSAPADSPPVPDGVYCTGFCYTARSVGRHVFELTVLEPDGRATTTRETVEYVGAAPLARVGPDVTLVLPNPDATVPSEQTTTQATLDATGSADPEGRSLVYRWRLLARPPGATVTESSFFSNPFAPAPRISLPATRTATGALVNAGEYVVSVTVVDPDSLAGTASMRVFAVDPANLVPSADAGLDRAVEITLASTSSPVLAPTLADPLTPTGPRLPFVRLDARQSLDANEPPQPLRYEWSVVSAPAEAPAVSLPSTALPTFAPSVAGQYAFRLVTRNLRFPSHPSDVTVRVKVAQAGNSPPVALARVVDPERKLWAAPGSPLLTFTVQRDRVILDATSSRDAENPGELTYRWRQVEGPKAAFTPNEAAPAVTVNPADAGLHGFQVTVRDPRGATDEGPVVRFLAVPKGTTPPELDVQATARNTAAIGEAVPVDPFAAAPRSLRVMAGTTVTLAAFARDPDVSGSGLQRLQFAFRQVAGPSVLLTTGTRPGPLESTVQFTPSTARVHVFEARARALDALGVPTGVEVSRLLRCVVDSPEVTVPTVLAGSGPSKEEVSPCSRVTLAATGSGGPDASRLRYTWVQRSGPPIVLSNPFSRVVTFVLPDAGGDLPQGYAFDCYVDDGVSRSEPAPVSLEVNPQVSRTAQLELEPGPNLLAFPVRPSDLAEPNLADVLRLTGAQFAVSMPGAAVAGGGRFRFFSRGAGGPDAVLGNEGFLVVHCGLPVSVPVRGPAWSAARQSRTLPKGLNLISYPRPCPGGETAEQLLQRTGAGFVVSTEAGSGGRSRFRVHLTGMTQPFPIRADRSYLLSMPASRVVSLPSCGP